MMSQPTDPPEIDDLWDYTDPAGSEARFRACLAQTEPGSSAYRELLTQIARAQGLQRNFAGALRYRREPACGDRPGLREEHGEDAATRDRSRADPREIGLMMEVSNGTHI